MKSQAPIILTIALLLSIVVSTHAQLTYDGVTNSAYDGSAFGQNTSATGSVSTAFGAATSATSWVTTAFGYDTVAGNNAATAWGWGAVASGVVSTAWGNSVASGTYSTAWGIGTTSGGFLTTAFGYWGVNATGDMAISSGIWTSATASCSSAWGYVSTAGGFASAAFNNSGAFGDYSASFGQSQATGTGAFASGLNNYAHGNYSTAAGNRTLADSLDSVAIGAANWGGGDPVNWVPTDPFFVVGNGSPGVYAYDALVVYKNGNTTITGTDNELPNQVFMNSHSILTVAMGDARYVNSSSKSSVVSTDNSFGQFQIGNPTSNGEASIGFVSGASSMGDSPVSGNGSANIWAVGAGVWGMSGSTFAIGNSGYGGPILNVTSGGQVGIGTSTPSAQLDLQKNGSNLLSVKNTGGSPANIDFGTYNISSSYPQARISTLDDGSWGGQLAFYTTASGASTNSLTERVRITPNGNVGIGTTSPSATLDVNGGVHIATTAKVNGSFIVTGTMVSGTVVASGTNLAMVPQQGDLSMGTFTAGATPQ